MNIKLKDLKNSGTIENVNINVFSFNFGSLVGFITLFFGFIIGFAALYKKGVRK